MAIKNLLKRELKKGQKEVYSIKRLKNVSVYCSKYL